MKAVLWISLGIIMILGGIVAAGVWMFHRERNALDPAHIVQLTKEKSKTGMISLFIRCNQEEWAAVNVHQPLPLASTVKIIVAIAYAQQAAKGKIDPQQQVPFAELERFYVPKTDGGAHEAWMAQWTKENERDSVPLCEVAKGMIAYSSNANTEYLMNALGLPVINKVLESLTLSRHEPLYPIVSALFVPAQLMAEQGLSKEEALHAMKKMDITEYRQRALQIHQKWLDRPPIEKEKERTRNLLDREFQKVWSDRLPRSTTADYVSIMEKLNKKTFFDQQVHRCLDPVMEQLMKNPDHQKWLCHAGQKGGSTAFVLTMAMYATDKQNNQTELAFFADGLTPLEQAKLSRNINGFQLKLLTDPAFRTYVKKELACSG